MESRQPSIWAACMITYVAALIAFVLRLVARRIKHVQLALDDYLALVAFLLTSGFTIVNLYKFKYGLGLSLEDIGVTFDESSFNYFRMLWIDSWFYTLAIGLSKLSVLTFYWRIFGHSTIKLHIQILFGCVIAWLLARIIIIPIQCIPIQKYWDRGIDGLCPIKTNIFFFATTFPHLLMELVIVVLPILKVRELHLPRKQKFAVAGMFASGTIVCVASLVQLIQAFFLDTSSRNIWWDGAPQLMCAVIEVNLGHFSTSLPNLRPIIDVVMGRKFMSASSQSTRYGVGRSVELHTKSGQVVSTGKRNSEYLKMQETSN